MKKILNKIKKINQSKPVLLLYLFIPILVSAIRIKILDNDFWFLINTGKYILKNGFSVIEPFTIHSNLSFVIQQWLTDVIFYGVYQYLGHIGIIIILFIINILIIYLLYKICYMISEKNICISVITTAFTSIVLSLLFLTTRPQIFDFVILLAEIYVLEKYIRTNNSKILWFLVLFSFLLINLHASSYFLLFLFVLPYLIDSFKFKLLFLKGEGYKKKPLFLILIPMFLVGLLNPYGISNIIYIFTSFGIEAINGVVGEMKNIIEAHTYIKVIYISTLYIVILGNICNRKNIKLRYLCLQLGTLLIGLSSIKGMSFFLIGGLFPTAYNLKNSFRFNNYSNKYSRKFIINYLLVLILFSIIFFIILINFNEKKENNAHYVHLDKIADYLDEYAKVEEVVLYTDYDTGSYMEYRGYKCYIDPRAEVFLKKNNHKFDIMNEFYKLQNNEIDIVKFVNKYNFNYLLVTYKDVLYNYLIQSNDYELLISTNDYYLFGKK